MKHMKTFESTENFNIDELKKKMIKMIESGDSFLSLLKEYNDYEEKFLEEIPPNIVKNVEEDKEFIKLYNKYNKILNDIMKCGHYLALL